VDGRVDAVDETARLNCEKKKRSKAPPLKIDAEEGTSVSISRRKVIPKSA